MALEIPYLELLPKEYKKSVKILLKKLQKANEFVVKYRLLQVFIEKYTGLPEIFEYWLRETINNRTLIDDGYIEWHSATIQQRSLKDFPLLKEKEWPCYNRIQSHFLSNNNINLFLLLPHSKLSTALQIILEEFEDSITPSIFQKYDSVCKLYVEMEKCNINDGKKYIEILKKTKNDEFVTKNVEIRLANNPWCQSLWKAYIFYLEHEKLNYKVLLQVLQRYCRLFIDDKNVKEKHQTILEEFSQISFDGITEYWIDSIKFYLQFNSVDIAITTLDKALTFYVKEKMKFFDAAYDLATKFRQTKMIEMIEETRRAYLEQHPDIDDYKFERVIKNHTFDGSTKMQKFPFSNPINRYLNDKISHQHLQKLYPTCKWFYYKYRYNLVRRFELLTKSVTCTIDDRYRSYNNPLEKYSKSSITFSPHYFEFEKLKNLWLTNTMIVCSGDYMPKILSVVVKITLKYLHCQSIEFSYQELLKLTESNTIEKIYFGNVRITKDNSFLYIEDILEMLPKLTWITFDYATLCPQPSDKLLSLKFENKFQRLNLQNLRNFDIEAFLSFLEINLAPKAALCFYYITHENYLHVKQLIETKIAKWKPECEKPELSWSYNDFI